MDKLDKKDGFLLNIIKSKLPKKILENVLQEERVFKDKWNLDALRNCIGDYVSLQAEVDRCMSLRGELRHFQQKDPPQAKSPTLQARNFLIIKDDKQPVKGRRFPPCCFCQEAHWSSNCSKVKTREARCKMLAEQNRCFQCLRHDHLIGACQSNKNCKMCNGSHHQSICPNSFQNEKNTSIGQTNFSSKKPNQQQRAVVHSVMAEEPAEEPQYAQHALVHTAVAQGKPCNNLLMSAEVEISGSPHSSKKIKVLALFDPGSQISFIRKELIDELKPRKIGKSLLDIHSALSDHPSRIRTQQYNISIHLADGRKSDIVVHSNDWINTTITTADMSTGKLVLSEKQPDLMINIGDFWKFFEKVEEISPSFYRVYTTLGPILCGRQPNTNISDKACPVTTLSVVAKAPDKIPVVKIEAKNNSENFVSEIIARPPQPKLQPKPEMVKPSAQPFIEIQPSFSPAKVFETLFLRCTAFLIFIYIAMAHLQPFKSKMFIECLWFWSKAVYFLTINFILFLMFCIFSYFSNLFPIASNIFDLPFELFSASVFSAPLSSMPMIVPQANNTNVAAYSPHRPGLQGETVEELSQQRRNKIRRDYSPISSDEERGSNNLDGKGGRRDNKAQSPGLKRSNNDNNGAIIQAIAQAASATKHCANVLRGNNPGLAIHFSRMSEACYDMKAVVLRGGQL